MDKKKAVEEKVEESGTVVTSVGAARPDVIFEDKHGRRWNAYLYDTQLHGEDERGYVGASIPLCRSEEDFIKFSVDNDMKIVEIHCDEPRARKAKQMVEARGN